MSKLIAVQFTITIPKSSGTKSNERVQTTEDEAIVKADAFIALRKKFTKTNI